MRSVNLLICLSFALGCLCEKNESEKVPNASVELTRGTFDAEIAEKNVLVIFHSPKCELTQRFLPKFEKIAEALNGRSDFLAARFNCDEDAEFCKLKNANGLAVVLYVAEQKSKPVHYKGVKSEDGLVKFLVKNLGDSILENLLEVPEKLDALNDLTDETFTDHVAVGKHFVKFYAPWCGHCQRLEPTWSELATSLEYDPSVSISRIDCTQYRHICQDYDVKGYPTLLWIVDGKKVEKYSGARSIEGFKEFIDEKAGVEKEADAPQEAVVEEVGVVQLTGDSFEHAIEKGTTIVKFYAPWCGHCKRMAPTWDELALKFIGNSNVKIAKVDCTLSENKALCDQQEIDGFPTVNIYKKGEKIEEYNGSRSLDDLVEYVTKHSDGHDEL